MYKYNYIIYDLILSVGLKMYVFCIHKLHIIFKINNRYIKEKVMPK